MLFRFGSKRFAVLCAALLAFASMAAHASHVAHRRDTRAEVLATDKLWRTAELTNDTTAMEKLLSDDYVGITAGGRVLTKAQQLDRMRTRQTEMTRLDVSDMKVRLVGSVAIVTSLTELDGTIDGRVTHGQFRSIRVYQRVSSGNWKIINFEATPLHRPHGPLPTEPGDQPAVRGDSAPPASTPAPAAPPTPRQTP